MLEHQKSKRDDLVTLARRSVMVQLVLVKPVMTGINKRHLPVRIDTVLFRIRDDFGWQVCNLDSNSQK